MLSLTDLIQRLVEKQNLVATGMKLLNEDTLGEVLGSLAHIREKEDLLLALLLVR
jgi:hypothetical protein